MSQCVMGMLLPLNPKAATPLIQILLIWDSMEQLHDNILSAFWNMNPYYLEKVFLSLQFCMVEILKCKGNNEYKLPHMGKDKFFKQHKKLPESLVIPFNVYQQAVDFRDDNIAALAQQIPEQRIDVLGPESDDEDSVSEVPENTPCVEILDMCV